LLLWLLLDDTGAVEEAAAACDEVDEVVEEIGGSEVLREQDMLI